MKYLKQTLFKSLLMFMVKNKVSTKSNTSNALLPEKVNGSHGAECGEGPRVGLLET